MQHKHHHHYISKLDAKQKGKGNFRGLLQFFLNTYLHVICLHILWLWQSGLFDYKYCCNTTGQCWSVRLNCSDAWSRDHATLQCHTVDRWHLHHSIMMKITWQRCNQSVMRLAVGHATNTHTRLTALCPGLPGSAGTRKVKAIWILLKQETVSGSGISWAICKSAPCSRQTTTPAPHHSVFTGRMPFLPPNQQRQSPEGTNTNITKSTFFS